MHRALRRAYHAIPLNGKTPEVHPTAFVAPNAYLIGDVHIGPGASVWFNCVLRADVASIRIGRHSNIQDGTVIHCRGGAITAGRADTVVGDRVTVGHKCLLHGCTIADDVLIGMGSTLMDFSTVGQHAIVGSCSLLPMKKKVAERELWAGSPAVLKRQVSPAEVTMIAKSWEEYSERGQQYLQALSEAAEPKL